MNEMRDLYNKRNTFNFIEFDQIKKRLLAAGIYSRFLIEIILEMLDLDTTTRPSPTTILKWLAPY